VALNVLPSFFTGPAEELIRSPGGVPWQADGSREYVREFRVRVNVYGKQLGANGAVMCPGIPTPSSLYLTPDGGDFDVLALLVRYEVRKEHEDDWQCFIVRCTYSTSVPEGGPAPFSDFGAFLGGPQNNPELERPIIRWDEETATIALPHDLEGKPFCTSAGQPFSPAPTFEVKRAVLVLTRNYRAFSRATITNYSNTVNADIFLGARDVGLLPCVMSVRV
jgi:hypothetical protein